MSGLDFSGDPKADLHGQPTPAIPGKPASAISGEPASAISAEPTLLVPGETTPAPGQHPPDWPGYRFQTCTFAEPPRPTPTLGDLGMFLLVLIATGVLFFILIAVAAVIGRHHGIDFAHMSKVQQFAIGIPAQAVWYAMALGGPVLLFREKWRQPFSRGVHWNGSLARLHWGRLVLTGVGLAIVVGIASTKMPMPKDAPIDVLFKSSTLAWVALVFGVFVAPAAEELAFRGFLLPALKGATGTVVSTVVTSAVFALMHAQQLAHAWGPLAVLFTVSLVLCAVRLRTASVACSTLVHASYNGFLFFGFLVATGGFRHLDKIKM